MDKNNRSCITEGNWLALIIEIIPHLTSFGRRIAIENSLADEVREKQTVTHETTPGKELVDA